MCIPAQQGGPQRMPAGRATACALQRVQRRTNCPRPPGRPAGRGRAAGGPARAGRHPGALQRRRARSQPPQHVRRGPARAAAGAPLLSRAGPPYCGKACTHKLSPSFRGWGCRSDDAVLPVRARAAGIRPARIPAVPWACSACSQGMKLLQHSVCGLGAAWRTCAGQNDLLLRLPCSCC